VKLAASIAWKPDAGRDRSGGLMTMRAWMALLVASLAITLGAKQTAAQSVCAEDIRRLCQNVPVGGGRVQACLQQHQAELSDACRKKLDELGAEVKSLAVVCRWDIGRLCSGVSPGGGRVLNCLRRNESNLSRECAKQLRDTAK
jgi:hypothetical protein